MPRPCRSEPMMRIRLFRFTAGDCSADGRLVLYVEPTGRERGRRLSRLERTMRYDQRARRYRRGVLQVQVRGAAAPRSRRPTPAKRARRLAEAATPAGSVARTRSAAAKAR